MLAGFAWFGIAGCNPAADRPGDWLEGVSLVPWNHAELVILADDLAIPLLIGQEREFGFCIESPPELDTSQWRASLAFGGAREDAPFAPAQARWGEHLCFHGPLPAGQPDGESTLCPQLQDAFDGRTAALPCIPFELRATDPSHAELSTEIGATLADRTKLGNADFLSGLDDLGERALAAGYPVLHLRLRLIRTYYLRQAGNPEASGEALRRLREIPAWLDSPAATLWAAMVHYEAGTLEMEPGRSLERAWSELELSREAYGKVLDPRRFTPDMKQAEILARAGAVDEAIRRLGQSLDSCEAVACDARLLPAARNTYGWLLLQDGDASPETLDEAVSLFESIIAGLPAEPGDLERANFRINLAYALLRRSSDPADPIEAARALLRTASPGDRARAAWLAGWADWIEARHDLRSGRTEAALQRCLHLADASQESRLRAWSYSCVADARRQTGDLDGAAFAIERALVHHELDAGRDLGQDLFLGPGQRADDFYRAARIEAERGRAGRAWEILDRLDRNCAPRRSTQECAALSEVGAARRSDLLRQLDSLDAPAAGARREQREIIRRRLLEQLQGIVRIEATCVGVPGDLGSQARYRGLPLADEIVLLRRADDGAVTLYRRTPIEFAALAAAIGTVRSGLLTREPEEADWRDALQTLAQALVPKLADLDEITSFTLHGILQEVPLDVLPLADAGNQPLVSRTTIALQIAASLEARSVRHTAPDGVLPRALFVVDPTGNLRTASREFVDVARFPEMQLLEGQAATPGAVRTAMRDAVFLHMDTHADYDPAFPELSTIRLSGGGLDAAAFRADAGSLYAANLSACRSGSWPATADSGRYGLAGVLVRAGAPWVIGARTDLDDRFARRFNREFYVRLSEGQAVPSAFRAALDAVRDEFPEPVWSALFLLGGS